MSSWKTNRKTGNPFPLSGKGLHEPIGIHSLGTCPVCGKAVYDNQAHVTEQELGLGSGNEVAHSRCMDKVAKHVEQEKLAQAAKEAGEEQRAKQAAQGALSKVANAVVKSGRQRHDMVCPKCGKRNYYDKQAFDAHVKSHGNPRSANYSGRQ